MPTYAKGHVRAPNKDHLYDLARRRHKNILLPHQEIVAIPSSWDSRQQGWIGPVKDQGQCGSCFPSGTLIRMADGSEKRIEEITTLDSVVTAEGNVGRVTHTMRRVEKTKLLKLRLWGHSHLKATEEHPILTERGYVKLSEIKEGDWVALPRYLSKEPVKTIQTDDFLFETNYLIKSGGHLYKSWTEEKRREEFAVGIPGKSKTIIGSSPMPKTIDLTYRFGRLVGLYLAEGSSDRGRITFSFHIREAETLAAEVMNIAENDLGLRPYLKYGKTTSKVTIYGNRLPRLFEALFSYGAGAKRLHPQLCSGPEEFLSGVLTGWMDGDCRVKGRDAVSVSRRLALSMFDIANALGRMPSFSTHIEGKMGKDGRPRKTAWLVGINDPEAAHRHGMARIDEKHLWRKVREIVEEPFSGDVFNLEVEGDHSYVAEGIGVHNCWDFSGTGVVEVAYNKAGVGGGPSTLILSEEYTLSCGRNGGCGGDDNVTVLQWAKQTGLPLTADYGPYQASAGHCKYQSSMTLYKIDDWGFADNSQGNGVTAPDLIKAAIMAYGCVGSGIAADNSFMNNPAGTVFDHTTSRSIDHDIILVGWDDSKGSKGAWLLRNSWGTSWCDGGYIWIGYGVNDVGTEAVWAKINASAPPIDWYM